MRLSLVKLLGFSFILFYIFLNIASAYCPMIGSKIQSIEPKVDCIQVKGTAEIIDFLFGATRACTPSVSVENLCDEPLTVITSDSGITIMKDSERTAWATGETDELEGEFSFLISYKDTLINVSGIYGKGIYDYVYCRDWFGNELDCENVYYVQNAYFYILIFYIAITFISYFIIKRKGKQRSTRLNKRRILGYLLIITIIFFFAPGVFKYIILISLGIVIFLLILKYIWKETRSFRKIYRIIVMSMFVIPAVIAIAVTFLIF